MSALLGLLLLSCGGDQSFQRLSPDIAWAPGALEFGQVRLGSDSTLALQIVNAGDGSLNVNGIGIQPEVGSFTISPAVLDLASGETGEVLFTFTPTDLAAFQGEVLIGSNDPETPLLSIPVTAEGIEGGPDIALDTTALDFGSVSVGGSSSRVFTIENAGDEELAISSTSTQQGSGAFALMSDPRGQSIPPGATYPVLVTYSPTSTEGDNGTLTLVSNDPDSPSVSVAFIGNGGGTASYPIATIVAADTALPGETATLDGSGSYDPGGNTPLTYTWTLLEQPEASATSLASDGSETNELWLDTAGSYTVGLQVENSLGVRSATAQHTIAAVPEDDIYVLLSWAGAESDFDLHLVRTDGTALFEAPDDCCWCNPNPSWGGDAESNPSLMLDADRDGGPENIVLPSATDGEYFVRVHYYQDDGDGETEATVRIFVEGEVVDQYRRTLTHNQIWDVAYVRWPQGFVVEENADPYASPARYCAE